MFCNLADSSALSQLLDPEILRQVVRAYQATATAVILMREVWKFRRSDTHMEMTSLTGYSWRSYCKRITATRSYYACCHALRYRTDHAATSAAASLMKEIDEEGRRIREVDRQQAQP
jgi:hypothetical protein